MFLEYCPHMTNIAHKYKYIALRYYAFNSADKLAVTVNLRFTIALDRSTPTPGQCVVNGSNKGSS